MRVLISSEATYSSTQTGGGYADLAGLRAVGLVDDKLGNADQATKAKSGYYFKATVAGTGSTATYVVGAAPDTAQVGSRIFAAATDGVIYANTTTSYGLSNVPTTTSGNPIGN
jgi:hypothetical protein